MRLPTTHRNPIELTTGFCLCLLIIGSAASAESLVDPTQPYSGGSAPHLGSGRVATTLRLEAILHGVQRRLAIINGQLVHEGDLIANNLIESITPTTVRYSRQGRQHTLILAGAVLPDKQLSIRPAVLTQPMKDDQP